MPDNIIVTGFGPFGEHNINASWESVKLLPTNLDGFDIVKKEIPVTYDHVELNIPPLWDQFKPILVVHVGVSSFTKKIRIEKCARRKGYQKADCSGMKHSTGDVCCTGDECIFTGLDVNEICNFINDMSPFESDISDDAGRYLCEFIYYTSLKINRKNTLFIHVPPLNEPYSARELSDGLLEIIRCSLKQLVGNCSGQLENSISETTGQFKLADLID